MPALDNFERFLHDEYGRTPPILKAGMAHAQFESIHPFLDGNGRVGRLLISLLFVVDGVLSRPFFYLSLSATESCGLLRRAAAHPDAWRVGGLAVVLPDRRGECGA